MCQANYLDLVYFIMSVLTNAQIIFSVEVVLVVVEVVVVLEVVLVVVVIKSVVVSIVVKINFGHS